MKTSAITLGERDVPAIMLFYAVHLISWVLLLEGAQPGIASGLAWALAAAQVLWHYTLIRGRTREGCFQAFRLNHWLGFCVFVGVVLAYTRAPSA